MCYFDYSMNHCDFVKGMFQFQVTLQVQFRTGTQATEHATEILEWIYCVHIRCVSFLLAVLILVRNCFMNIHSTTTPQHNVVIFVSTLLTLLRPTRKWRNPVTISKHSLLWHNVCGASFTREDDYEETGGDVLKTMCQWRFWKKKCQTVKNLFEN